MRTSFEKIVGVLLLVLLVFNFFYLLHINNTFNEKQKNFEEKLVEITSQVKELREHTSSGYSTSFNTVEFLKQEYINYREFANSDRESFMNLINLFFIAVGVLITGAIIVIYWIFGQTKMEVKENADLTIKSFVSEIERDAKEKIKNLIDPKIKDFEEKYRELERIMENQHLLRKSKVIVLGPENKKEGLEKLELKSIRSIVEKVDFIVLGDFDRFKEVIEKKEVDIIIYRYEKGEKDEDKTIRKYIQILKDMDMKIPVVVYAKDIRIDDDDLSSVKSYPFSVIANMPTSLTINMMSLVNILSFERSD